MYLRPAANGTPIATVPRDRSVEVLGVEGDWAIVAFQDTRGIRRQGYVQRSLVAYERIAAPAAPPLKALTPPQAAPTAPAPTPQTTPLDRSVPSPSSSPAAASAAPAGPPPSLRDIRRVFIESMPNDLDQYISAEITKQLSGRVIVVLNRSSADAILRGVGENRTGVGAAITGRYLGLHDNASGSIALIDPQETVVLWASEAGDRSLLFGVMKRGGQRKVADRLVNNLKKALNTAK